LKFSFPPAGKAFTFFLPIVIEEKKKVNNAIGIPIGKILLILQGLLSNHIAD